ncbi:hypothetical protein F4860DRAFT_471861 [Xylaria cubensis]|nr:hypothetical protein F4860DRAFT_471861 [Xylaria cubensis]
MIKIDVSGSGPLHSKATSITLGSQLEILLAGTLFFSALYSIDFDHSLGCVVNLLSSQFRRIPAPFLIDWIVIIFAHGLVLLPPWVE